MAYFPFITYRVFDATRTTQKTLRPTTFECTLACRLKAGIVEPEETVVVKQWLGEQVAAATNTYPKMLLVGTHTETAR
jgi:hypothetical protein